MQSECFKLYTKMFSKSLNDIKNDISILTLNIEILSHDDKIAALNTLRDTIGILNLGNNKSSELENDDAQSSAKKIKLENNRSLIIFYRTSRNKR